MSAGQKLKVSIAFSPDTDDAFMVHAMREGHISHEDYEFTFVAADIQQLNEKARQGVYDVTAISVAAYPDLATNYLLMPIGASIGDEFGPAVIVPEGSPLTSVDQLTGQKVAVPGRQTSAFFAATSLFGPFEAVPLPFYEIAGAVHRGEVKAGLLIHELQLNCERFGFRKLGDLGRLWHDRHQLPLPLGANAIRRSLGPKAIADVTKLMRDSIVWGLERRSETLAAALRHSKADLDLAGGDKYISMYVNGRSLAMEPDVRQAIAKLYALGEQAGLCPRVDLDEALYS